MARIILENWWIKIRWYVACLGVAGKMGVGLIVLALIFFMAALLPQKQVLKELQNKVESVQLTQLDAMKRTGLDDTQILQMFYDFLPHGDSSPYWISELDRLAKENGVEFNSSDYRLMAEKVSRLVRYEIKLPVRGSYPQIRAFIANSLLSIPALALTDISIKRETVQIGQVEARLNMSLYLHDY